MRLVAPGVPLRLEGVLLAAPVALAAAERGPVLPERTWPEAAVAATLLTPFGVAGPEGTNRPEAMAAFVIAEVGKTPRPVFVRGRLGAWPTEPSRAWRESNMLAAGVVGTEAEEAWWYGCGLDRTRGW